MVFAFEYHTYLHHSQTHTFHISYPLKFEYHTYLHHSQTNVELEDDVKRFEYHTYLHHSQTDELKAVCKHSLNTIHIYIILKLGRSTTTAYNRLNTIHIYIILKQSFQCLELSFV